MINAIVAVNEDWGIGYNGNLLESIPADLKNFKELTTNNVVIMGSKTWDSLPKKPLPNRNNVIITRKEYPSSGTSQVIYMTLEELLPWLETSKKEIFIIGGGIIYKELLPYCNRVYITKIYKKHENVDTYFPNLDKDPQWKSMALGELENYKDFSFQFWQYDRIT